jgi:tRNA U38,U39,U40 pseudouridine synthase TruA
MGEQTLEMFRRVFYAAADIRRMASAALDICDVAAGRISPDEIPDIITSCDRSRAGITAPPEGLYLNRVVY